MPTDNVAKKHGKATIKIIKKRETSKNRIASSYNKNFDLKMAVLQELIALGAKKV
jgi:hypothetical protein